MADLLDPKERSARGTALQEKIYGQCPPDPQTPWEESVRDFVYAEVWNRPGLDMRARFLIAIAGAALCRFPEGTIQGVIQGALRTGELRIDTPLPPKPNQPAPAATPAPAAPAAAAAPVPPPEKRLSPLEMLRLERQQAKAAAKVAGASK